MEGSEIRNPSHLLGFLFLLCACQHADASATPSSDCPQRLVSLHDVTTEAVVELGAARCLVGVSEPTDVPDSVRKAIAHLPRVGSAETVVAVKPDEVLALEVVREHEPELAAALLRRKVPFHAPRLERVADVHALITHVAKASGKQREAERWLAPLAAVRSSSVAARPRVFVFDCCAPPFTAGQKALITDLIARAGGQNIFAEVADGWFNTSWEAAAQRKPDVILIDDYGAEGSLTTKREALAEVAPLAGLPVVVVKLRDVLGTLRTADVIAQLRTELAGTPVGGPRPLSRSPLSGTTR
jgi:iron complex transport system substrate-binding protein